MGFSQLFGKEAYLGVDIGSSAVKVMEVERELSGWRVASAAVEPMPAGSCRDGVIINIDAATQAVSEAIAKSGTRATKAITAISGSQVIVRQVQFPKMTETTLRKSIKYEASRFISAPMDESVVEFEILGDSDEPEQMNVMLAAAPREMIESRLEVIQKAGCEPVSVDVEAFALQRTLVTLRPSAEGTDNTIALIDMGATHTDVNLVCRGEFALTRNIPIAGDSFTNGIRAAFNVSVEEAEKMKHDLGISDSPSPGSGEGENRLWRAVQPMVEELIREIRRSVNFFQTQYPEGSELSRIEMLLLAGGSALIPGIGEYLSSRLNIRAEVADVFDRSVVSLGGLDPEFAKKNAPLLAVVLGLAMKEHADSRLAAAA